MWKSLLPWFLVPAITASLLLLFGYFAPLEITSVTVYAGIVLGLTGMISLIKPIAWFGIRSRRAAMVVEATGLLLFWTGLLWPASTARVAAPDSLLDGCLKEYEFSERHEVRIQAPPDRVVAAMAEVTLDEIGVIDGLMRVRGWFLGTAGEHPSIANQRVLESMTASPNGFITLASGGRETVLGMAGRPWANEVGGIRTADDFKAFQKPDSVKAVINLKVEDDGGGWSRMITETRIRGTDDSARRKMARYWRLIYPGSGMIRRMWLNAIRDRASRA